MVGKRCLAARWINEGARQQAGGWSQSDGQFIRIGRNANGVPGIIKSYRNVSFVWQAQTGIACVNDKVFARDSQPKDGRYTELTLHGPDGTVASAALPKFVLPLDAFFAQ